MAVAVAVIYVALAAAGVAADIGTDDHVEHLDDEGRRSGKGRS